MIGLKNNNMIGFIIGFVIGMIPTIWFIRKDILKKKDEKLRPIKPKYIRRGILTNGYSISNQGVKLYEVDVQFEIGELESTDNLSKVEVISCVVSQSKSNTPKDRKDFSDMINNSWIDNKDIKWITTLASKRNDKIDNILND
jgi:hypothetical protein